MHLIKFLKIILSLRNVLDRIHNKIIFKIFKVVHSDFKINGRIVIRSKGSINIGKRFSANSGKINNPIGGDVILRMICLKSGVITIGNNVGISNSTLVCWEGITIEDNVMIGGGCKIWDTDFHSLNPLERIYNGDNNIKTAKIYIRKNVFIGGGVTILKGIEIGSNSIIAAGSVVVKNIPKDEIWGGNPAIFLKKCDATWRETN